MSDSSLDFHTEDEIFEFDPEIGEKKPCANRADIRFVRYCENIVEAGDFENKRKKLRKNILKMVYVKLGSTMS